MNLDESLMNPSSFIHSLIQSLFILRILTLKFHKNEKIVNRNKTDQIRAKKERVFCVGWIMILF